MNNSQSNTGRRAIVLLVEDSPADQLTVERALEEAKVDCHLMVVENGNQALSLLRGEPPYADCTAYPRPDLVLMDINMPIMDGITTLKHIRNDSNLRTLPVVMLTTSDTPNDINTSYTDGANAFVTKPVNELGFIEAVQKLDCFWFQLVTLPVSQA